MDFARANPIIFRPQTPDLKLVRTVPEDSKWLNGRVVCLYVWSIFTQKKIFFSQYFHRAN